MSIGLEELAAALAEEEPQAVRLVEVGYEEVAQVGEEYLPWLTVQRVGGLVKGMALGVTAAAGWLGAWIGLTRHAPSPQPPRSVPGRTTPLVTAVTPDTPTVPPGPLTGVLQVIRETITAMQAVITRHTAALARAMWQVVHVEIPAAIRTAEVLFAAPGYRMARDIATVAPGLARKARLAGMPDAERALSQIPRDFPVLLPAVVAATAAAVQGITRIVDDCVITDCQDKQAWKHVEDSLGAGLGDLAGLALLKFITREPEAAARWTAARGMTLIGDALLAGAGLAAVTGGIEAAVTATLLGEAFLHPEGTIKVIEAILLDP